MTERAVPPSLSVAPESPDRNLALELVRVTEAAAMAAGRWVGKGDKNGADGVAVNAMRVMISSIGMNGVVVIGEGEKDNAPMLYNGEQVGDGTGPDCDVAVDPIDGTRLAAEGKANALAVIAVSERGSMFDPGCRVSCGGDLCGKRSIYQKGFPMNGSTIRKLAAAAVFAGTRASI